MTVLGVCIICIALFLLGYVSGRRDAEQDTASRTIEIGWAAVARDEQGNATSHLPNGGMLVYRHRESAESATRVMREATSIALVSVVESKFTAGD